MTFSAGTPQAAAMEEQTIGKKSEKDSQSNDQGSAAARAVLPGTHSAWNDLTDKEKGIQLYKLHNYSDALKALLLARSKSQQDAEIHYYLGNCWIHMNYLEMAEQEYRIAADLEKNTNSRLASYCSLGISNCESELRPQDNSYFFARCRALGIPVFEPAPRIRQRLVRSKLPIEGEYELGETQALRQAKDQAEVEKNIWVTDADSVAMYETSARAEPVRTYGRKIAQEMNNLVTSFEDQLKNKQNTVGTKLLPLGSNLYVRNYSVVGTLSVNSLEQPQLTATQEKLILDRHERFTWSNRTAAGQGSQSNDSSRTTAADVYGRLLQNK
jgi:tetratricopeptide (TPR) repeat protein